MGPGLHQALDRERAVIGLAQLQVDTPVLEPAIEDGAFDGVFANAHDGHGTDGLELRCDLAERIGRE